MKVPFRASISPDQEVRRRNASMVQSFANSVVPAIWGIWNAVRYMRRQRSLLSILTASKKKDEETFVAVKALVATAAIQISDGTASTMLTSDAMNNVATYRQCAEEAIRNLELIRK